MNYTEIVTLALNYADREDDSVVNNMDNFLRMVESRINRELTVQKMSARATILTVDSQEYYGLPSDFQGMRDIEIQPAGSSNRNTMSYLSPEQMNQHISHNLQSYVYTIIADQLQISPSSEGDVLEIVYYQNIPPLATATPTNWVSDRSPDLYLEGLMVEINSFVKDAQAAQLWDVRFRGTLSELTIDDAESRWSGTSLQIRNG